MCAYVLFAQVCFSIWNKTHKLIYVLCIGIYVTCWKTWLSINHCPYIILSISLCLCISNLIGLSMRRHSSRCWLDQLNLYNSIHTSPSRLLLWTSALRQQSKSKVISLYDYTYPAVCNDEHNPSSRFARKLNLRCSVSCVDYKCTMIFRHFVRVWGDCIGLITIYSSDACLCFVVHIRYANEIRDG